MIRASLGHSATLKGEHLGRAGNTKQWRISALQQSSSKASGVGPMYLESAVALDSVHQAVFGCVMARKNPVDRTVMSVTNQK